MKTEILVGDCRELLRAIGDASVDAIVTDPPAGIGFMCKDWDSDKGGRDQWIAWLAEIMRECLRVLKPGGHALVWALPRTSHWTATAVENAGFEIRDVVTHLFGTGFPKGTPFAKDKRFCQCVSSERSGGSIGLEQSQPPHTDTVVDVHGGVPPLSGALHSTSEAEGFPTGYQPDRDFCGELPPRGTTSDQSSVPSLSDVPARTRSFARGDGLDCEQGDILSQIQYTSRHANTDSQDRAALAVSSDLSTDESRLRAGISESVLHTPDTDRFSYSEHVTGLPRCQECGLQIVKGWNTALKPAAENWILARRPLVGTVAANVIAHGTGALNIDASRIGYGDKTLDDVRREAGSPGRHGHKAVGTVFGVGSSGFSDRNTRIDFSPLGRWPANVILDEHAAVALDEQAPIAAAKPARSARRGGSNPAHMSRARGDNEHQETEGRWPADPGGGVSRYFYVSKASRKERELGCEGLPLKSAGEATDREDDSDGLKSPRAGAGRTGGARNFHPTVKSISLMRYLCRLVTPPGGIVLDPFAGSGTTGIAALLEGFNFIGLELSEEYAEIARARIRGAMPLLVKI